jgi:proteasome lid subunit RPN8/RPN11
METWQQAVKDHALSVFPHESCGMLFPEPASALKAVFTPNVAPDSLRAFEIAPSAFLSGLRGGVVALFHSHPTTGPEFSTADKKLAESTGLPLWLYCVKTDSFHCYKPTGEKDSLYDRAFELGSHDCAGLVIDYYQQNLALNLESFRRVMEHVNGGWKELIPYMKRNNLFKVTSPKEGDIILMTLGRASYVNHCGVYLEGNRLLHQLINRRSGAVVYGGYWKSVTAHILRHKSKL